MKTRRSFLVQGTLATTAIMFSGMTKSFGNTVEKYVDTLSKKRILILHSCIGDKTVTNNYVKESVFLQEYIQDLYSPDSHLVSLHEYDNALPYRIEKNGDFTIGIIIVKNRINLTDTISYINKTAQYLKLKKDCHLIICKLHPEMEITTSHFEKDLAKQSEYIDVIAGNAIKDKLEVILNCKQSEVYITHSNLKSAAISQLTILVNRFNEKCKIDYIKVLASQIQAA